MTPTETLPVAPAELDLTVLVPAYNEVESLPELIDRVCAVCVETVDSFEVLVIDDGSDDGTREQFAAWKERWPALGWTSFQRNYGKSAALAVGFERARGAIVITMDADLQDDPDEIPRLIAKLNEGYDLVSGWKQDRKDPFIKNNTSKIFNFVTGRMSGLKLHDFNCGLKAYRRAVTDSLEVYGEMHRYLPVLAHVQGFRVTELPVKHRARPYGETKFGRSRFLNGLLDLFTVLFLTRQRSSPLHFFGRVALLFGAVGGGICAYFLALWMTGHGIRLRPLVLLGISFLLVAIQFISLGLLAELLVASRNSTHHYRVRDHH